MTIEYRRGDIFASGAEAIVCEANAQGRLGAGQALEVRRRFPDACRQFSALLSVNRKAGRVAMLYDRVTRSWVAFASVKDDPHESAKIGWVDWCAEDLALAGLNHRLASVALPALGCGNGGLAWSDVRPIFERELAAAPDTRWLVYEPLDALRVPLAHAIAAAISSNIIRANAWVRDNGVRVYLAIDDRRIGWIGIDAGLGLHAGADTEAKRADVRRWVSAAEEVKRKMLMDHG